MFFSIRMYQLYFSAIQISSDYAHMRTSQMLCNLFNQVKVFNEHTIFPK